MSGTPDFGFDQIIERRGSGSYKWDSAPADVLAMWVADMDFETAPVIVKALQERVAHGIFGYTKVLPVYYEAVCSWFSRRHGWAIRPDWIQYTIGVVPALSAVIKALTEPGDGVLTFTPVYHCFFSCIRNNRCKLVESPLVKNAAGLYEIDWEGLEGLLTEKKTRLLILSNPHNPGGRVWTADELARLGGLCARYGVRVVSDEIHGEFVFAPQRYIPFASVNEVNRKIAVTCTSASKAFNTASLQLANIICEDEATRCRIDRAINDNEVCDINPFGVAATIAAYSAEGEAWLEALLAYLTENDRLVRNFFAENLSEFPVMPLQGTYLEWISIGALGMPSTRVKDELLAVEKLWVSEGREFGAAGEGYLRLNIACPRSRLLEGLQRLEKGLRRLMQKR